MSGTAAYRDAVPEYSVGSINALLSVLRHSGYDHFNVKEVLGVPADVDLESHVPLQGCRFEGGPRQTKHPDLREALFLCPVAKSDILRWGRVDLVAWKLPVLDVSEGRRDGVTHESPSCRRPTIYDVFVAPNDEEALENAWFHDADRTTAMRAGCLLNYTDRDLTDLHHEVTSVIRFATGGANF